MSLQGGVRRIFVDVSTIKQHDARTGIQRVVRALAIHLADHAYSELELFAVWSSVRSQYQLTRFSFDPEGGLDSELSDKPLELGAGDVFLGLDLSAHLLPLHEKQIVRWKKRGARIAIVVYDLLPHSNPEWFNRKASMKFERWLGVIARRADILFPISQHVSNEIGRYLTRFHSHRAALIRRYVLTLSGDIAATAPSVGMLEDAEELMAAIGKFRAVLMVGTIEPRKSHSTILAAHQRLLAESPTACPLLIIVGKPGWRSEKTQASLARLTLESHRALWLSNVSDEMLDCLYRVCSGLIAGSLDEGYCLPIAEALSYGKPVLARDIPVFREFSGPGVSYFDNDDPAVLSHHILELCGTSFETCSAQRDGGWRLSAATVIEALTTDAR